ncbi:hypothetical protein O0I10_009357, partial [Lichtheimia ornata]
MFRGCPFGLNPFHPNSKGRARSQNIHTLTAPLDELRNVDKLDDEWTDEHTDAFIAIQKILTNTPILRYPNMAYPFSWPLTPRMRVSVRCCIRLLMVKLGTFLSWLVHCRNLNVTIQLQTENCLQWYTHWKNSTTYLWGNTLYTDHRALYLFAHPKSCYTRIDDRLVDHILEYKFDVVHLPGLDNILPDQLSRLFPTAKELRGVMITTILS